MMIAISTLTASAFGFGFDIDPRTETTHHARRSSRTPTLDGGAVLVDSGWTPSDETVRVVFSSDMPEMTFELLRQITQLYSTLLVFLPHGAYLAHPKSITRADWTLELLGPGEVTNA